MSCDDCAGGGRREFLRELLGWAAGAALAAGVPVRTAEAMPVYAVRGVRRRLSQEVRYPIPAADGVEIDRKHEVILVRHAGAVYAFALSCPHQNTALRWNAGPGQFQCPKHKSKYQPDGTFIDGRATRNMDRLPIRRDGAAVLVDVDKVFESDHDKAGWDGAVVKL